MRKNLKKARFDVFLSHDDRDSSSVEVVAKYLKENKISVWFDKWNIAVGENFQTAMAQGMMSSKHYIIFIGEHTPKKWFEEEISRALVNENEDNSKLVIPILLPKANTEFTKSNYFLKNKKWLRLENLHKKSLKQIPTAISTNNNLNSGLEEMKMNKKIQKKISIEVSLRGNYEAFDENRKNKFLNAISSLLEIPKSELKINRIEEGSIKLELEIPNNISDKLLKLLSNEVLKDQGVFSAKKINVRNEIIKESLSDFNSLEHRMEFVAQINGVNYINDSKATNINSTWYALESIAQPIIWIAGGLDKGNDYSVLKDLVKQKVKGIITLGIDNKKIQTYFKHEYPKIKNFTDMKEAVREAKRISKEGDLVLLSPACASFDLFSNYVERGNAFKIEVKKL